MIKIDFSVKGDILKIFQQMTRDNSASNLTFLVRSLDGKTRLYFQNKAKHPKETNKNKQTTPQTKDLKGN